MTFSPNTTQVPNIFFEHWMAILTPAEFKVLMVITRKTLGWHKIKDAISLSQIIKMTGLSNRGVINCLSSLIDHKLINKLKRETKKGDSDCNEYQLIMDDGKVNSVHRGSELTSQPVVNPVHDPVVNSVHRQKKLYTKETKQKNESQSDRKRPSETNVDFSFDREKGKFEGISDEDTTDWKIAYPDVDLKKELVKMEQWLKSNPSKSHRKKWRRFVTTWLGKTQDRIENKKAYNQGNTKQKSPRIFFGQESGEDDLPEYIEI